MFYEFNELTFMVLYAVFLMLILLTYWKISPANK